MEELGYDLTAHHSKSLDEVKTNAPFDVLVTMGCGDACPWMPAKKFVDWQLPNPKNMEKEFNAVRDLIEKKVKALVEELVKDDKNSERTSESICKRFRCSSSPRINQGCNEELC
jgi:arsenate reductase (thioredoxin)